jgi:Ca2+-binding EF-hand superfamily protein
MILVSLVARALSDSPLPGPAASASIREAVYFDGANPIRIRFRVALAGRSVDEVWTAAVNQLFQFLDRDGDGTLCSAEWAAVAPRRARDAALVPDGGAALLQLNFGQRDPAVTRHAFAAAVRSAGYGPIEFLYATGRTDSAKLSSALFRHLDADGDGKLSVEEVKMARERLAPLDANEDEFISADELLGRSARPAGARLVNPAASRRLEESSIGSTDLTFLDADVERAVQQILSARGGSRATSLNRRQFGADQATFATLDVDGNGLLDATELAAWLRRPPDVDLALTFATGRPTLAHVNPAKTVAFRSEPDGSIVGGTAATTFRFDPPAEVAAQTAWQTATARLREQFKQLAKAKGTVDRAEVEKQPALLPLFELADRGAKGKVSEADVEASLAAVASLAACRVEIRFLDQGNGLFELLDKNGDGQLSPRELVEAPAVLKPFADRNGCVAPANLKRRFVVRAMLAAIPAVVAPTTDVPVAEGRATLTSVPAWFAKMDRNGDGEVSLREFLGPLELFRKLDRNGDGLISAEEARAADSPPTAK